MNTVANPTAVRETAPEPSAVAAEFVSPAVDIFEDQNSFTIRAELPGVTRAGLEITLEGAELTILGRREKAGLDGGALYRESTGADYRRAFELDAAIDTAKIDAHIEQGLLTVRLPKSEQVKPRKITVTE